MLDSSLSLFVGVLFLLAFGVAALIAARVGCRGSGCRIMQSFFFVTLLLMGGATIWFVMAASGYWVACGAMLGLMVIGATLDCGGGVETA